jgi:hypothetical protein
MAEPKTIVEYGKRCLLCRNDSAASRLLCWKHCDDIRDMLDGENLGYPLDGIPPSIPVLYRTLDVMPGSTGLGERRAPGFESTPPLSMHRAAMRDPRTLPSDDDPVRSVLGTLAGIAYSVVEELDCPPPFAPRTVYTLCAWLSGRLEALTRLPWADDMYRDLTHLRDQLRAAHGDPLPRSIGHCTNVITVAGTGGGSSFNHPCGNALFPPRDRRESVVQCGHCGKVYDGIAQLRMSIGDGAA